MGGGALEPCITIWTPFNCAAVATQWLELPARVRTTHFWLCVAVSEGFRCYDCRRYEVFDIAGGKFAFQMISVSSSYIPAPNSSSCHNSGQNLLFLVPKWIQGWAQFPLGIGTPMQVQSENQSDAPARAPYVQLPRTTIQFCLPHTGESEAHCEKVEDETPESEDAGCRACVVSTGHDSARSDGEHCHFALQPDFHKIYDAPS